MQEEIIKNIISKYLEDTASVGEINQLDKWYDFFDNNTEDLYLAGSLELEKAVVIKFLELKLKLGIEGTNATFS